MNNNLELIYWTNNGGVELPLEDWQFEQPRPTCRTRIPLQPSGFLTSGCFGIAIQSSVTLFLTPQTSFGASQDRNMIAPVPSIHPHIASPYLASLIICRNRKSGKQDIPDVNIWYRFAYLARMLLDCHTSQGSKLPHPSVAPSGQLAALWADELLLLQQGEIRYRVIQIQSNFFSKVKKTQIFQGFDALLLVVILVNTCCNFGVQVL